MEAQNELSITVMEKYLNASATIRQRIDQLLSEQTQQDLNTSREIADKERADREKADGERVERERAERNDDNGSTNGTGENATGADNIGVQVAGRARNTENGGFIRSRPRMENLELATFSGEQSEWAEWKSTFESLVNNEQQYTSTEKFHYLKKSLSGMAANLLKGWLSTGENYDSAYKAVVEVFKNKYRMFIAFLSELFNIPHQTSETFGGLRQMIDTTNSVIRQLRVVGSPVDSWDQIMVHILITRMSPRTLSFWENSNDLTEMPLLKKVMGFLERRARSQVNYGHLSTQNPQMQEKTKPPYANTKPKPRAAHFVKTNTKTYNGAESFEQRGITCFICKGPHPLIRCEVLLALTIDAR